MTDEENAKNALRRIASAKEERLFKGKTKKEIKEIKKIENETGWSFSIYEESRERGDDEVKGMTFKEWSIQMQRFEKADDHYAIEHSVELLLKSNIFTNQEFATLKKEQGITKEDIAQAMINQAVNIIGKDDVDAIDWSKFSKAEILQLVRAEKEEKIEVANWVEENLKEDEEWKKRHTIER